ncbi:MAG: class I SAM-dependent methyltransferase [Massilia sp.]
MSNEQVVRYYAKSVATAGQAYDKPERQEDLAELREQVMELLDGHIVLELACGDGYWTSVLAETADSVLATDINPAMIAAAEARRLAADKVRFRIADGLDLPADIGEFTAVFAGFFWSHLRRDEQDQLLAQLRKRLGKDVLLVLVDDVYVEGSSESIARTDAEGTTWQILNTADGERFEIPKSYPSDSALRKRLASSVREIKIARLEYYWLLTCRLK